MDDGDPVGRHLQLMQRLLAQRGASGADSAADIAQAMAQLARGFGGGGGTGEGGPRERARQSMSKILANISNTEDDSDQYSGLSELCNQLNMATEEVLAAIRPEVFAGPIAACLSKEYNPELQLVAARCLTYMVDAIPMTAVALTSTNAIDLLLDRLRSVTDVELSEQCLTCVEKISSGVASSILQRNGISAILSFVDFFGISIQRKAWATVSSLSKKLKPDQVAKMLDVLPQIRQSVTHEDAKIREAAIQTLYRVILTIRTNPELIMDVFGECGFGVMEVVGRGFGGDACFPAALQLALAAVSYSPLVASGMIDIGFAAQMSELLGSYGGGVDATPTSRGGASLASTSNASPLGNSESARSTPPSLATPLRSTFSAPEQASTLGTPQGSRSKLQKTLTPDMQKQICAILTALLPRISEGYMPFLATLNTLQMTPSGTGLPRGIVARAASEVNIDALEGMGSVTPTLADDDDEQTGGDGDDDETALRAELAELMATQDWVRLETRSEKHRHCRANSHSCDVCGADKLALTNWFRCNHCADFDICLSCMVSEGNGHHQAHDGDDDDEDEAGHDLDDAAEDEGSEEDPVTDDARHTFTDMSTAVLFDASREAAQKIIRDAANKRAQSDPRIAMFAEASYFVQRVVEALPNVIRLRLDSEHPRVQHYAFAYVARAVHFGTAEDLRRVLVDAPLCEAIVTALADKDSIESQVTALYIASQLVRKLPDIYCGLFIREGVTNGLASMKSAALTALSKHATPLSSPLLSVEHPVDVKQCCSSKDGWNKLICAEVSAVLAQFPTLNDPTRSNMWASVCQLLRERNRNGCQEAFEKMRFLVADASTFELMNCSVLSDLRTAFQMGSGDVVVATVVEFVFTLSRDCPNNSPAQPNTPTSEQQPVVSNFTKFVRLLQSTLSQLENFKPAKFSSVSGINSQLRLNIVPHNAAQYAAERTNKQFPKPDAAAAAATSGEDQSGADSAPVSPVSPAASTPSTDGRQAHVSIEPLASLAGVMDFVRQNLLPNARSRPASAAARGDDEDVVDEVLPEAQRQGGNRTASPVVAPQQVYLRVGRHALPSTMTMLQISQRYGKKASEDDPRVRERKRQLRDVPPELRALLDGSEQQPMVIHYSTVPWGRDIRPVDDGSDARRVAVPSHGVSPSDPIQFVSIGERVMSEGCVNINKAIYNKFDESHKFLSQGMEDVLSLLGIFYNAVCFWDFVVMCMKLMGRPTEGMVAPTTSLTEFVNVKLNSKAMRHSTVLLLAGQHQSTWAVNLAMDCNFLFTSETRKFLFEVSFFGTARSLVRMQEYLQENGGSFSGDLGGAAGDAARRQHRLQRIKKRVWRERCLDCAVDVFNGQRGIGNAILEFEFYNEEGSGLGPTLEFYTLTGDAFRERKYRLWRSNDEGENETHYQSPQGLFPRPLSTNHTDLEKAKQYFRVLGRFLGRAILDRRIPNIRLSRPLVKILRGDQISFDQLQAINDRLFAFLKQTIADYCEFHPAGVAQSTGRPTIEDMGITFVAPGDDDIELIPGGADIAVTRSNVLDYINRVAEFFLKTGIEPLMIELRSGFHELVPLHALRILTVDELQSLMDGHTASVTLEELEQNCAADHGFTLTSQPVRWLFEVIASMAPALQQRFFQFLTGSPFLPVGGLRCLRPRLTIVRKTTTDATVNEVDQLPSAMTCQNYLKLPAYETKEALESKLLKAVEEGCGVFLFT